MLKENDMLEEATRLGIVVPMRHWSRCDELAKPLSPEFYLDETPEMRGACMKAENHFRDLLNVATNCIIDDKGHVSFETAFEKVIQAPFTLIPNKCVGIYISPNVVKSVVLIIDKDALVKGMHSCTWCLYCYAPVTKICGVTRDNPVTTSMYKLNAKGVSIKFSVRTEQLSAMVDSYLSLVSARSSLVFPNLIQALILCETHIKGLSVDVMKEKMQNTTAVGFANPEMILDMGKTIPDVTDIQCSGYTREWSVSEESLKFYVLENPVLHLDPERYVADYWVDLCYHPVPVTQFEKVEDALAYYFHTPWNI